MSEYQKTQTIRLIDVFFIGPFLIYIAHITPNIKKMDKLLLFVIGLLTILYNGDNYLKNKG